MSQMSKGAAVVERPASAGGACCGVAQETMREADPAQVREWMQSGACVLVDVREPDEHARERISGSRLVPLSRFDAAQVEALIGPGKIVVMHCKSGRRSADACRLAARLGDKGVQVYSMAGGIEAWKKAALPVACDAKAPGISVMRQVQMVIGASVLAGCALAWFADPKFLVIPAFFGAGLLFAGASGTCALASIIGKMPWNRVNAAGTSCSAGVCG